MSVLSKLGRWLLELGVRVLFWPGRAVPIDPAKIRRVLVVRPDPRVGNVLLTVPLCRALAAGLPGATVDLLVARGKERLVQGLPFIHGIVRFDKRDFFRAPWRFWRTVRALRRARYDVAIDASHFHVFSFTSAWLVSRTRAPVRIGHRRGLAARFLTHPVVHDPATVNDVEAKLELLAPLGLPPAGTALETLVGRDGPQVLALLAHGLPTQRFAAINLGARKTTHRWAPEHFGALALRLVAMDLVPLLLWGPGEEALCDAARVASRNTAVKAPPTNLDELAAAFRVSAVAITNDTGPMHLACAVGAKVVAVFLSDDAARWAHPGPRFRGVRVRDEAEPVDAVARAVAELLQPSSSTAAR